MAVLRSALHMPAVVVLWTIPAFCACLFVRFCRKILMQPCGHFQGSCWPCVLRAARMLSSVMQDICKTSAAFTAHELGVLLPRVHQHALTPCRQPRTLVCWGTGQDRRCVQPCKGRQAPSIVCSQQCACKHLPRVLLQLQRMQRLLMLSETLALQIQTLPASLSTVCSMTSVSMLQHSACQSTAAMRGSRCALKLVHMPCLQCPVLI